MNEITRLFIESIGAKTNNETVTVYFYGNHAPAHFSAALLADLASDPAVAIIASDTTGEILFDR